MKLTRIDIDDDTSVLEDLYPLHEEWDVYETRRLGSPEYTLSDYIWFSVESYRSLFSRDTRLCRNNGERL